MEKDNDILTVGQASEYIGRSVSTLQRWDRSGEFKSHRNKVSNRRFYYRSELDELIGKISLNKEHRKIGEERITLWGNKKHHTKHNEYICYGCGAKLDRDQNASMNLYQYPESNWLEEYQAKTA